MMAPSGNGSCPFPVGLDRYVIAQNGPQIVEAAFFVGHGDQPPVAVSGGNFDAKDRGAFVIGASGSVWRYGDGACRRHGCEHQQRDRFHGAFHSYR